MRYFVIIAFLFLGCRQSTSNVIGVKKTNDLRFEQLIFEESNGIDSYGNPFGDVNLSINGNSSELTLNTYRTDNDHIRITLPDTWKIVLDEYLVVAEIDNSEKNYFLILNHSTKDIEITLEEYMKNAVQILQTDELEPTSNLEVKQIEKSDGRQFYALNGNSSIDGDSYRFISYYFEYESNIYDVSLKYLVGNKTKSYEDIFELVCEYIVIDNYKPFSSGLIKTKDVRIGYEG